MIFTLLNYLSKLTIFLGNFFLIASVIGLIRNKDFYIKLHTISMFNIYGANFILFSIGILSHKPVIFFEMLFVIIINTLITLVIVNCLFRNAILSEIPYRAKSRDEITLEQAKHNREAEKRYEMEREKEEERKVEIRNKMKQKEKEKQDAIMEKERLKEEKKREKEAKKLEKKRKEEKVNTDDNITPEKETPKIANSTEIKPIQNITKKDKKTDSSGGSGVTTDNNREKRKEKTTEEIEAENEELKKKIKEQKRILRKKIETIRRNAFITRKPEEIQKAEDLINSILTKYNLNEEMLKDDDE